MADETGRASPDVERRPGETTLPLPDHPDAGVFFIGRIGTPWPTRSDCPKRGAPDGPECRIEVDARWQGALEGIERHEALQVLYWMHLARRDLATQHPRAAARVSGTFALRSPMRPNPIASSTVRLVARRDGVLIVRGLDCVDGTPLIDLKPDRCPLWRTESDLPGAGQGRPSSLQGRIPEGRERSGETPR